MGQGISNALSQSDWVLSLCAIKQEWADGGKAKIAKGYERLVSKGKLDQAEVDKRLAAITTGLKEALASSCDLIVEAAFEDMKVKKETFAEHDTIRNEWCIFAYNTSSLPITEIGAGLSRPLVVTHFFNPADAKRLIAVIAVSHMPV